MKKFNNEQLSFSTEGGVYTTTIPMKEFVSSEKELVRSLSLGSEKAFCELYALWWERLKLYCYHFTRSHDLAENFAQEVFLKIWENRIILDPDKSFPAFIHTVARNMIFNYLRHTALTSQYKTKHTPTTNPREMEESIEANSYMELLHQGIKQLTPRQQEVFRLSRQHHLTQKEIAEQLGISIYTVEEYISISLKALRKYIAKNTDIILLLLCVILLGKDSVI